MRLHRLTLLGLIVLTIAALGLVSLVRLQEAQAAGSASETREWATYLVASALALAVLVLALVGKHTPAVVYAAVARLRRLGVPLVVAGQGSTSLEDATRADRQFFSRCVVASPDGIGLWSPFARSTRLPWSRVQEIRLHSQTDDASSRMVVNITTANPRVVLEFWPQSQRWVTLSSASKSEVRETVRAILNQRP